MENTAHVRAQLTSVAIKNGIVLQFELESDSKDALPQIAMMARHFVTLDITDDQMAMDLDEPDEGPVDGQLEADFEEPVEEPGWEPYELPEPVVIGGEGEDDAA